MTSIGNETPTRRKFPRRVLRAVLCDAGARVFCARRARGRAGRLVGAGRCGAAAARRVDRRHLGRTDAGDEGARPGPGVAARLLRRGGGARSVLPGGPAGHRRLQPARRGAAALRHRRPRCRRRGCACSTTCASPGSIRARSRARPTARWRRTSPRCATAGSTWCSCSSRSSPRRCGRVSAASSTRRAGAARASIRASSRRASGSRASRRRSRRCGGRPRTCWTGSRRTRRASSPPRRRPSIPTFRPTCWRKRSAATARPASGPRRRRCRRGVRPAGGKLRLGRIAGAHAAVRGLRRARPGMSRPGQAPHCPAQLTSAIENHGT